MIEDGTIVKYVGDLPHLQNQEYKTDTYNNFTDVYGVVNTVTGVRHVFQSRYIQEITQSKFNVGDKVFLKSSSNYFDRYANPKSENEIGEIIEVRSTDYLMVKWDFGINSYNPSDLGKASESQSPEIKADTESTTDTECRHEFIDVYGFTGKLMGRSCKHCDIREEDVQEKGTVDPNDSKRWGYSERRYI